MIYLKERIRKNIPIKFKLNQREMTDPPHRSFWRGSTAVMWKKGSTLLQAVGLILLHQTGRDTASIQTPADQKKYKVGQPIPLNSQWKAHCFMTFLTLVNEMKHIFKEVVFFCQFTCIFIGKEEVCFCTWEGSEMIQGLLFVLTSLRYTLRGMFGLSQRVNRELNSWF